MRSQKEGNGKYPHGFALSDITIMFLHPKILHHRKVWGNVGFEFLGRGEDENRHTCLKLGPTVKIS